MGPMEARRICGGRVRLADFNRAKRFSAVEELVKVIFGVGEEGSDLVDGIWRDGGAVGGGDGDVGSGGAEGFGEVVAGLLGTDEEKAGGGAVGLKRVGE